MAKPKDPNRPCPDCGRTPTETEFATLYPKNIHKSEYRDKYCKECRRKRQRKKTANHAYKENWLMRKYGIDMFQYNERLKQQNGNCAICGLPPEPDECLVVDHDHRTGEIRGLLHNNCNIAIGLFKDNPEFCSNAANYLRTSDEVELSNSEHFC